MSLTLKINLSKLLKLSHSKSWEPSAVVSVFTELTKRIPNELMNASNRAFSKKAVLDDTPWQAHSICQVISITSHLRKSRQAFSTSTTAGVGTNLYYARIHQLGGNTRMCHKIRIPARPYFGLDDYA